MTLDKLLLRLVADRGDEKDKIREAVPSFPAVVNETNQFLLVDVGVSCVFWWCTKFSVACQLVCYLA